MTETNVKNNANRDEMADAIMRAGEAIADAVDRSCPADLSGVAEELKGVVVEVHHGLSGVASAVHRGFVSAVEDDSYGGDGANVADGLFAIARAIDGLTDAVRSRPADFDWEQGQAR